MTGHRLDLSRETYLGAIWERLEQAMELSSAADVEANLAQIKVLCAEVSVLAEAGAILTG